MLGAALLTLAALAQPLAVRLAPDQPAPIFFTDEPLVVQFQSTEPMTASADVAVTLPNGEHASWTAQGLSLIADRPTWHGISSFPVARGPHLFHVRGDPAQLDEFRQTLVRIDRPNESSRGLVAIHLSHPAPGTMYALRCLPVAAVRMDADTPNLAVVVRDVALNTPGRLYLRVPAGEAIERTALGPLAEELGDIVDLWEIAGAGGAQEYAAVAGDIRRGDPGARLAARVSGARDAVALGRLEAALCPDVLVVSPDSVEAVEQSMQRTGVEGVSLIVEFSPPVGDDPAAAEYIPRLLESSRMPYHEVIVPQRMIESSSGFSGALSILASATRLFDGTELIGELDVEGNNRAWLYGRPGDADPPDWVVAVTYTDPGEPQPEIPAAAAESWRLYDAHGNVRAESATPQTPLGDLPGFGLWFVRGSGGDVLLAAHVRRMKEYAALTLPHEESLALVAPDSITALKLLRNYTHPSPTRVQFINLVRSLPAIEEAWHRGIIEPRDAVPLSRYFAAMVRELATIAQEMDEPFLEPLERTFSNCRELLKAFPEAQEKADARRVRFLRAEVARLLDEASACEAAGRVTEAKGVAALAEWRARSLEPAASIPLLAEEEVPPEAAGEESPAPEPSDSSDANPSGDTELDP